MQSFLRLAIVAVGAAIVTTACERDSSVLPSTRPTLVTIIGPASVAPGGTAQFRATVRNLDGSSSDVTAEAIWSSSTPDILEMRPGGVAVGKARGPAVISVRPDPSASIQTMRVLVLEDGTFELSGRVLEADTQDPLAGAQIEVEEGLGVGLRATSGGDGRYLLYGVGGAVRLKVSADGYPSQAVDLTVSGPTVRDIAVTPQPPSANLSGEWVVAISAPTTCQALPTDARSREFVASIEHTGTPFTAEVSSPTLVTRLQLNGRMVGDAITLDIPYFGEDFFEPPSYHLLDALQPAGFLGIGGIIRATGDGQRFDGSLNGDFAYYPGAVSAGGAQTCFGRATVGLVRTK